MNSWHPYIRSLAFLTLLIVAPLGCGKDKEPEPAPPAPAGTPAPKPAPPPKPQDPVKPDETAPVEETLEPTLKLSYANESIDSTGAFASLKLGVLQVRIYPAGTSDSYPAVLLWSKAGVDDLKALEGNTIEAQVFVQKSAEALPLHASDGATVKLKISKVQDKHIAGEVIDGSLLDIESGNRVSFQCTFVAELQ